MSIGWGYYHEIIDDSSQYRQFINSNVIWISALPDTEDGLFSATWSSTEEVIDGDVVFKFDPLVVSPLIRAQQEASSNTATTRYFTISAQYSYWIYQVTFMEASTAIN